jgi:cytochrome c553
MHERLDGLALVEPLVVRGDLEHARSVGEELFATMGDDDAPTEWRPHVAAVRVELRALTHAEDLAAAASATARVAAQCGACHEALAAAPRLDDAPMPGGGNDEAAAMRLHAWAVGRMREGLIGPSLERWLQGTATFAALPGCREPDPARSDLCKRTKLRAHRAHVADSTQARVLAYGELLATCAACHRT